MSILKSISPESFLLLDEKQFIYKKFFFVKKNNRNIRINIEDIFWIKADGSSVKITTNSSSLISYSNLTSFQKQIQNPNLFRVHRSYIVNLANVTSFDDQFLYIMAEKKEFKIPLGRTYRKDTLQHFNQLKSD